MDNCNIAVYLFNLYTLHVKYGIPITSQFSAHSPPPSNKKFVPRGRGQFELSPYGGQPSTCMSEQKHWTLIPVRVCVYI